MNTTCASALQAFLAQQMHFQHVRDEPMSDFSPAVLQNALYGEKMRKITCALYLLSTFLLTACATSNKSFDVQAALKGQLPHFNTPSQIGSIYSIKLLSRPKANQCFSVETTYDVDVILDEKLIRQLAQENSKKYPSPQDEVINLAQRLMTARQTEIAKNEMGCTVLPHDAWKSRDDYAIATLFNTGKIALWDKKGKRFANALSVRYDGFMAKPLMGQGTVWYTAQFPSQPRLSDSIMILSYIAWVS